MEPIRPRALRPGDIVGVAALSGPIDADALDRGRAELEAMGFRVRVAEGVLERRGFNAGSLDSRAAQLRTLLADDEVAAIVCARGGAGAGQLVPRIEPELVLRRPKPLVGCSDVTALHLAWWRLGVVGFQGPMVARDLATGHYDRAWFLDVLCGRRLPATEALRPLRGGSGEGVLLGGCLSLLASAAGTPWALPAAAAPRLLFVEDIDEPPYRVDRMLFQLRSSGALEGLAGIVFGEMPGCQPGPGADHTLEDVVLGALDGLAVPVAFGLACGHTVAPALTLPVGVRARLTCGHGARLDLLEPGVA